MKYIRLLFYILFISKTIVTWGGENIGGLSFRAYEYSKDERTSFIIPSGNQGVRFKDYLSVSFDLKIREKGEHFDELGVFLPFTHFSERLEKHIETAKKIVYQYKE